MASLLVHVRNTAFQGAQLEVEIELRHTSGGHLATLLSVTAAPVTPANFASGIKTQVIAFVLARFGVTLLASDILIFGAPQ